MTDPIELAVLKSALHSIAEEMGAVLRRSAFSPNIKERRDYSSAIFDSAGNVIAMGDDMPVHLGSMPMSVRAALDHLTLVAGDIAILNDPFQGGTHLPDITLVMPVPFADSDQAFFVANRAHHADVGGMYPGSMGTCREIWQEGVRIPPLKIVERGALNRSLLELLLANVRTPREREGDLTAQIGACRMGVQRVTELVERHGIERLNSNVEALLAHSEALLRTELSSLPDRVISAEDFLDDDGISSDPVPIRVTLTPDPARGSLKIDFTGSAPQVSGSLNAVAAITYSAIFYVIRCLLPGEAAPTAGLMRPLEIVLPERSVVNANIPAAVAGGNVETSQRIVDVLLRALSELLPNRIPAASSGSMSNLTIGGIDPRTDQPFAYYETVAGGAGAGPHTNGPSGAHTHMTNSLNTPVEALEYAYPFRVHRYGFRSGSGGRGHHNGGDGLVRDIEVLAPAHITVLSERRKLPPYGLRGGENGSPGRNLLMEHRSERSIPGKFTVSAAAGTHIRIETPGGGGWGRPIKPEGQE